MKRFVSFRYMVININQDGSFFRSKERTSWKTLEAFGCWPQINLGICYVLFGRWVLDFLSLETSIRLFSVLQFIVWWWLLGVIIQFLHSLLCTWFLTLWWLLFLCHVIYRACAWGQWLRLKRVHLWNPINLSTEWKVCRLCGSSRRLNNEYFVPRGWIL